MPSLLTMRVACALAVAVSSVFTLSGCSSSSDDAAGQTLTCTPNTTVSCACPGGLTSTATCLSDGTLAPCNCASPTPGTMGAGGTPASGAGGSSSTAGASGSSLIGAGGSSPAPGAGGSAAGSFGASGAPTGGASTTPPVGAGGAGEGGMPPEMGSGGSSGMTTETGTPSAGCGVTDVPAGGEKTIDVGGTEREYIVTVPSSYDPNKPHLLIFAWHGLGGTSRQIASTHYGLASRAGDSAIFIAAQALSGTGQQAGLASWTNTNDRDITFTRQMLEWAKTSYCIDEDRVFSIGMSNGGLMSNVVACELGDSFRAMVAMSGGGPKGYALKPCTGQVAVWISHGNRDNNVPYSYGEGSRDYWTGANHCSTSTETVMPGPCLAFQGCDDGFPVQFCEFDGGHMIPSYASEAAWQFFSRF